MTVNSIGGTANQTAHPPQEYLNNVERAFYELTGILPERFKEVK